MRMITIEFNTPDITNEVCLLVKDKLVSRLKEVGISVNRTSYDKNHIWLGYQSTEDCIFTSRINRLPIDPASDRAISLGRNYLETKKLTQAQAEKLMKELNYLKSLRLPEFSVDVMLNSGASFEIEDFLVPVVGMYNPNAVEST